MFDHLALSIRYHGDNVLSQDKSLSTEHKDAIITEVGLSMLSSLRHVAMDGGCQLLANLFDKSVPIDNSNRLVIIINQMTAEKIQFKFPITEAEAMNISQYVVPKVLTSVIKRAIDPKNREITIEDFIRLVAFNNEQYEAILRKALDFLEEKKNEKSDKDLKLESRSLSLPIMIDFFFKK